LHFITRLRRACCFTGYGPVNLIDKTLFSDPAFLQEDIHSSTDTVTLAYNALHSTSAMAQNVITINKVPTLEGSHSFMAWKAPCILVLKGSNVWKFVEGTPEPPTREGDEKVYKFQERLEKFKTQAEHVCSIILCTCNSNIQQILLNIDLPKACWDRLIDSYEQTGIVHDLDVWHQFTHIKYSDETIEKFCAQFSNYLDKCVVAEVEPNHKMQILHFIDALKPHFIHWASNKRNELSKAQKETLPKLATLQQEVRDEACHNTKLATLQVITTKPSVDPTRSKPQRQSRDTCVICRLPNHSVENCYYVHRHLCPPNWKPNPQIEKTVQAASSHLQQIAAPHDIQSHPA
jgi:hypothetical protein